MITRALIVILVVLNLGTAIWWMMHSDPHPVLLPAPDPDAAPLEIVDRALLSESVTPDNGDEMPSDDSSDENAAESDADTSEAQTPVEPPTVEPQPIAEAAETPPPPQCYRLGPFTTQDSAARARSAIQDRVSHSRVTEIATTQREPERYRILYPPLPSREEAQALTQRIRAAGFTDYYLIDSGEWLNGIALGIYRNRQGAERQASALTAAGFAVDIIADPASEPVRHWWLDAEVSGTSARTLRNRTQAAEARPLDCPPWR